MALTVLLFVGAACLPRNPKSAVEIDFYSSSTKEDWVNAITESFNAAQVKTGAGQPIVVRVTHVNSGGSQRDILDGKIQPTVWSPGDLSWVKGANQEWQNRTDRPLVSESCEPTVYEPIGFAMWRPMAEAMGWPDRLIGWEDVLALASDPQGWARYGHPEWGQFRFGHTLPDYSNSGLLILTALAYSALGQVQDLAPEQVKSNAVVQAMREVELHTYQYGVQSARLIELMVQRGPSYLHAVNTNEAEVLKSNARYGSLLPFQLVFIFPAGGTFWAQHPFCILDAEWVTGEQREAARLYRDYLLAPQHQTLAVDKGLRPANPAVALHPPIALENGTDPRVTPEIVRPLASPSAEVAGAIKDVFHLTKKHATVIVLLDTSGGMQGDRIGQAIQATEGWLKSLRPDDEVIVYAFNSSVVELQPSGRVDEVAEALGQTLRGLQAKGEAALYDTLCLAVQRAAELQAERDTAGDRRVYGIVVVSGGPDTASRQTEADLFNCLSSPKGVQGTRVFPVIFGNDGRHQDLLQRIANSTGGEAFPADTATGEDIYLAIYVK